MTVPSTVLLLKSLTRNLIGVSLIWTENARPSVPPRQENVTILASQMIPWSLLSTTAIPIIHVILRAAMVPPRPVPLSSLSSMERSVRRMRLGAVTATVTVTPVMKADWRWILQTATSTTSASLREFQFIQGHVTKESTLMPFHESVQPKHLAARCVVMW